MIQGYINFSLSFLNIQILFIKRLNKNKLCISKYPFSNGTRERGKDCLDRALLRSHLEYTMIRKGKNKMLKIYDE